MSLDLKKYSPAARLRQIKLGEEFGSRDTLAQGNQTLKALKSYGTQLAAEGFTAKDGETLAGACEGLVEAGVGREAARGEKLSTSQAYVDAMNAGQAMRMRARSFIEGTLDDLEEIDTAEAADAARVTAPVLKQTAVTGEDAEALAKQLDLLGATLVADGVKAAAEARGSAEVVSGLGAAAKALRAANAADTGVAGTPAETQLLDQLDGIIVRVVRRARKASIAASKNLGDPAIAKAFKLDKLYQARGGASTEDVGEDEGADGEDVKPTAPKEPTTP